MAGKGNLRSLTTDEARKIGRAGGIASGKSRREIKAMREMLELLMGEIVDGEDKTRLEMMMVAQVKKAMAGDTKAAEFVRDTSGQRPEQQISVKDIRTIPFTYDKKK